MLKFDLKSKDERVVSTLKEVSSKEIAVIGISVNLPCAQDLDEMWTVIENGLDCNMEFPQGRQKEIDKYLEYVTEKKADMPYRRGAYLEEVDRFEADFFQITKREAQLMNPIQRLVLESVYHLFEDAGYSGTRIYGSNTGIYMGMINDLEGYKYKNMIEQINPSLLPGAVTGLLSSYTASRVSYLLNLSGPSMLIDTACSSSLAAIHQACQALRNGDCEMAVAGGVRITLAPYDIVSEKIGIESSDGCTRAFDGCASGSGLGEGVASILLKPYLKAKRDNDHIYAKILGSAVNQDGTSLGMTAPNPKAHTDVILKAWRNSNIHPDTIGYYEAHGTGTKLGDPIEIDGLIDAFRKYNVKPQSCAIGSLKSNYGHQFECAGIASFIKCVLALQKKKLPPTVHFEYPSENIHFENSPVYVNSRLRAWNAENEKRRCAISSFGISGTNCHMILEEEREEPILPKDDILVFTLSAFTEKSLRDLVNKYIVLLQSVREEEIADICYTLNTGREHLKNRIAFAADDIQTIIDKLKQMNEKGFGNSSEKPESISNIEEYTASLTLKAKCILENTKKLGKTDLEQLCSLYVNGGNVNWKKLYLKKAYKKISLPGYPFHREQYWFNIPKKKIVSENLQMQNEERFYQVNWVEEHAENDSDDPNMDFLVWGSMQAYAGKIVNLLKEKLKQASLIEYGSQYKKIADNHFMISNIDNDFMRVMQELNLRENVHVVYVNEMDNLEGTDTVSSDNIQKKLDDSLMRLFHICTVLKKNEKIGKCMLSVITANAYSVSGDDSNIHPEQSALLGFAKCLNRENISIQCKGIDIDHYTSIANCVNEILSPFRQYSVAYRKDKRYIEKLEIALCPDKQSEAVPIKENGVYVIFGGLGGVGLSLGEYISKTADTTLILVSRREMPDCEQWDEILKKGENTKQIQIIAAVNSMRANGSKVILEKCDITNKAGMKQFIDKIVKKYGNINGMIHAAGKGSHEPFEKLTCGSINQTLEAKILGTLIIDELIDSIPVDFFVLCSSVAAYFFAGGQSAYAAANSFIDSFTAQKRKEGKPYSCINWTTWKSVGMAAEHGVQMDTIFKLLPCEQAVKAFDYVLRNEMSHVIAGTINYESAYYPLIETYTIKISDEIQKNRQRVMQLEVSKKKEKSKRSITNDQNGVEENIMRIYKEILGFEDIGAEDSFFELGGNSILLNQAFEEINKIYPDILKVADLFSYTTISSLAEYIAMQLEPAKKGNEKEFPLSAEDALLQLERL